MSKRQTSAALLSRRYARALFDLAVTKNTVDAVASELAAIAEASSSPALKGVFASPLVSAAQQRKVVGALTLSEMTQKFLGVLVANRRLSLIAPIAEAFTALARAHRGEAVVEITSAAPLSAEKQSALTQTLEKATKQKITLNQKVDASLLGGLVIRQGSKLLDLSLKGKLRRLTNLNTHAA